MKITIHEEKNSHFTFHGEKKGPITSHENTLYHPLKWQGNGCDIAYSYYFGSDIKADQAAPRYTAQYPFFQTICLQREGLEATIVCLCQVRGMRTPKELK